MMTTQFNAGMAYSKYKSRQLVFYVAAFTAFLMSSYFMVTYFAGDLDVLNWTADQWKQAIASLGVTFVMTAFQFVLYSDNKKGKATAMTVFAALVAVFFAFLTEIGQGMEREEQRMMQRSVESPTYQAMLEKIGSLTSSAPTANPYAADIAAAQMKYNQCLERLAKGREPHCEGSKGRLESYQQQAREHAQQAQQSSTSTATALFNEAKGMEKDESNHHPLVKLMIDWFGVSSVSSSFIISLLIIGAFEFAFHFLGGKYGEARDDLEKAGYLTTRRIMQPPRKADGTLETFNDKSAPVSAFTGKSDKKPAGSFEDRAAEVLSQTKETVGNEMMQAQAAREKLHSKMADKAQAIGDGIEAKAKSYREKLEASGVVVPPSDSEMDKTAADGVKIGGTNKAERMPLKTMLERIHADVLASGETSPDGIQQAVKAAYLNIPNPTPMDARMLATVARNIAKKQPSQTMPAQSEQQAQQSSTTDYARIAEGGRTEAQKPTMPAQSEQPELTGTAKQVEADLYPEWLAKVKAQEITPAAQACKQFISQRTKNKDAAIGITAPEMGRIWSSWQERAANDGILISNPKYKPGNRQAKYKLAS